MSPKLADALRVLSFGPEVFNAGAAAYRAHAETLLGSGPDVDALPWTRFSSLPADHRRFAMRIVDALLAEPNADPRNVLRGWIGATSAPEV